MNVATRLTWEEAGKCKLDSPQRFKVPVQDLLGFKDLLRQQPNQIASSNYPNFDFRFVELLIPLDALTSSAIKVMYNKCSSSTTDSE